MGEAKLGGVQRLPMKLKFLQYLAVRLSWAAVDRVADQRMADRSHVDADLVGPPGLQPAFDESGIAHHRKPLPVRDRPLAAAAFDDRDLLPVHSRARKRRVHRTFGRLRHAVDDRQIAAVDPKGREPPGPALRSGAGPWPKPHCPGVLFYTR